jgi:hypothetical protein
LSTDVRVVLKRRGDGAGIRFRPSHQRHPPLISWAQRVLQKRNVNLRHRLFVKPEVPYVSDDSDYQEWVTLLALKLETMAQGVLSAKVPPRKGIIDHDDVGRFPGV